MGLRRCRRIRSICPGSPPNDKILILEDTDGDGRADKQTVFADKLYLPTGIEFWDGGVIVAQQPNLMFLKDTNGDDKADVREIDPARLRLGRLAPRDHAFMFDPGGALYFNEGTFHHSQIETPYGPERCANAGVFRYEPRTGKLDVFVSYGFANPWGHIFDRWGQNFVADASRRGATTTAPRSPATSIIPHKHAQPEAVPDQAVAADLRLRAGLAAATFPHEAQGNFLLNNCIGFQGMLQYKMKDEGSGFAADPVEPLLQSSDPSFRPVDIEFGPDGALYMCDWYNPLVGHMQHSIRDPNRDHAHGRIWRIHYTKRPLVKPAKIAGAADRRRCWTCSRPSRRSGRTTACARELWNRADGRGDRRSRRSGWPAWPRTTRSTSTTSSKRSGCTRPTTRSTSRC